LELPALDEPETLDCCLRNGRLRGPQKKAVGCHVHIGVRIRHVYVRDHLTNALCQRERGSFIAAYLTLYGAPPKVQLTVKSRQPISKQCIKVQA
jgi:hypothetical protein